MARVFLLATLLVVLLTLNVASAQYTVCQNYSGGADSNSTTQVALLTAIVVRAATGGTFKAPTGPTYDISGLFNASGPLYDIFTGTIQYRVGAPNYVKDGKALGVLAGKLVAYFGALFGCTAMGFPAVSNYNMYVAHKNMSINNAQETYFNTQLALTLLSFGVDPAVVKDIAAPALGLFNRCGPPLLGNTTDYLPQICGAADCPLATGASPATCKQFYNTSSIVSSYPIGSTGSSLGMNNNGASGMYAASGLLVAVTAFVASLLL